MAGCCAGRELQPPPLALRLALVAHGPARPNLSGQLIPLAGALLPSARLQEHREDLSSGQQESSGWVAVYAGL